MTHTELIDLHSLYYFNPLKKVDIIFWIYIYQRKEVDNMSYSKPMVKKISLEVKGNKTDMSADGPSKCSSSCCFYRDGATW